MSVPPNPVYLGYLQPQLDAAYDQTVWAPNREQVVRRHFALSAGAVERLGCPQRYAYGPAAAEYVDVFRTTASRAPMLVFVHGGAWKTSASSRNAFIAEAFVAAGAHVVLVEFSGVEEVGGRLEALALQVRRAVAWIRANAQRFDADPDALYLAGHSSGAHLVSTVLLADPAGDVKAALCCSGMYDLVPVSLSRRNTYVDFTAETIDRLSAIRHVAAIRTPLVIAHGTEESPEFVRQSEAFAAAARADGRSVELVVGEGYNHFEILETLGNPYGVLGRAAFRLMGLAPSPRQGEFE